MIVSDIIEAVAKEFKVSPSFLIGTERPYSIMPARFALYTVFVRRGMSRAKTGKVCGGRDHTTVMHGLDRAEEMMDNDHRYRSKVEKLIELKAKPLPKRIIEAMDNHSRKRTHTDYCEAEFD